MSYHTLQRLVVRMLFDDQFVSQVYANPDQALANLELTPTEQQQLIQVDQRAWGYDPLRRKRTLRTLVEEFKASTTLALAETRSLASLDQFFSSSFFHTSVQNRGSMGLAFSQFLGNLIKQGILTAPQLPDVLRLETVMAGCRRELDAAGGPVQTALPGSIDEHQEVRLSPGVAVGRFQGNTIETIQKIEQYLFEVNLMPAMVLCDDAPRLPALPVVDEKKKLYLQCVPSASGVSLVNISREEFLVLSEAKRPTSINRLVSRAGASAIPKSKALEIIVEALEQQHLTLWSAAA